MQLIMSSTYVNDMDCIQFVERTDEEDFVGIYKGEGCNSQVNYIYLIKKTLLVE
jgi:hypothetical protein